MYDIFYIKDQNDTKLEKLRKRFPLLKTIEYSEDYFSIYQTAQKKSMTKMFWIFDSTIDLLEDIDFSSYIVPEWDLVYIHVFRYGVYLMPKKYQFTKEEIKYNFFLSKKDVDMTISKLPYDAVFISYNEPNADENYEILKSKISTAKRVHGVVGIHQAHIAAAKLVNTNMFWVIDGDAQIVEEFDFRYKMSRISETTVHTWRSINPINGLEYGYGGVKLFPTNLTLNLNVNSIDMTTSISKKFKPMPEISNITAFNTDPFNTWKSAFRECVKLSSKIIDNQKDSETSERLDTWCSKGKNNPYGEYAIKGAIAGRKFGLKYSNDLDMLVRINDWEWLQNEFNKQ